MNEESLLGVSTVRLKCQCGRQCDCINNDQSHEEVTSYFPSNTARILCLIVRRPVGLVHYPMSPKVILNFGHRRFKIKGVISHFSEEKAKGHYFATLYGSNSKWQEVNDMTIRGKSTPPDDGLMFFYEELTASHLSINIQLPIMENFLPTRTPSRKSCNDSTGNNPKNDTESESMKEIENKQLGSLKHSAINTNRIVDSRGREESIKSKENESDMSHICKGCGKAYKISTILKHFAKKKECIEQYSAEEWDELQFCINNRKRERVTKDPLWQESSVICEFSSCYTIRNFLC